MRLPFIVASAMCSLTLSSNAQALMPGKNQLGSRKMGLEIRVAGGGWGTARLEEITSVLYSVADELLTRVPKHMTISILVTHTEAYPIARYEKGPGGDYRVRLHAKDRRWHLYAYEFAHELSHIMANYELGTGIEPSRYNQWFEETLCEMATLYTLKGLAATWLQAPPPFEWEGHAENVRVFADMLISEGHRQIPPHTPLAAWLKENGAKLRADSHARDKNEVITNLLLPLFETDPDNWDALCYLSLNPADARNCLDRFLHNWYRNAPADHKVFLADVLDLVGLRDAELAEPSPAVSAQSGSRAETASVPTPMGQAGRRQP